MGSMKRLLAEGVDRDVPEVAEEVEGVGVGDGCFVVLCKRT